MTRITKPVEERRQEIIDTARKLFMENGFDKTQVADISKNMTVAQGLVYYYFKSKTDILYAVIDEMATEQTEMINRALEKSGGSAFEELTLLFNSQPAHESHNWLIQSVMSDPAITEYCTKKMMASVMPLLISLIERGNADGSWNCEFPKETATFILQGMSGVVGLYEFQSFKDPKIQAVTNIVFRILGVKPPPLQ